MEVKKSSDGGTSSIPPAKGAAPLWTPPSAHAGHPQTPAKELRPSGLPLRRARDILHRRGAPCGYPPAVRAHHPPWPPSWKEGGIIKKKVGLWRHILHTSCQRGCAPLDAPFGARGTPSDSCQRGCAPLDSPCPPITLRLLPKGLRPSGLPACTRWGTPRAPPHLAATAPGCTRLAGCPTSSWRMRPASTQAAMTP